MQICYKQGIVKHRKVRGKKNYLCSTKKQLRAFFKWKIIQNHVSWSKNFLSTFFRFPECGKKIRPNIKLKEDTLVKIRLQLVPSWRRNMFQEWTALCSSLLLLRKYAVHFITKPIEDIFFCPEQLCIKPNYRNLSAALTCRRKLWVSIVHFQSQVWADEMLKTVVVDVCWKFEIHNLLFSI